jgi:hypothetical protein
MSCRGRPTPRSGNLSVRVDHLFQQLFPRINDKSGEGDFKMQISPITKFPDYTGPRLHVPNSIAQGDTIDNNDNLPDAGGGVVAMKSPSLWPSLQPATASLYQPVSAFGIPGESMDIRHK